MSCHKIFTSISSYFIFRAAADFHSVQIAVYPCSSLDHVLCIHKTSFLLLLFANDKTLRYMVKIVELIVNTYACFPENSLVGFRSGTQLYEKLLKHELTEVSGACILCILDSKGDNTWMITFVNIIPWWK